MDHEKRNSLELGQIAPDFTAQSTAGEIKFSEYNKGSWVIFFSHPGDFTPVCTTELTGFAQRTEEFNALNTKLLGISIDSINAHIAWVNNVKRNSGVLYNFPIISDVTMKIARLYGMVQNGESDTTTVRSLFIIDPTGKVRLTMHYPLNVGRNMDEIIRALTALQTADKYSVSLPLNWKEGDKVIVNAPETLEELSEREQSDLDMMDFYLAKRNL